MVSAVRQNTSDTGAAKAALEAHPILPFPSWRKVLGFLQPGVPQAGFGGSEPEYGCYQSTEKGGCVGVSGGQSRGIPGTDS